MNYQNLKEENYAQIPKLNKNFIENLDNYILDQFPFRNEFINLNSNINRNILQMTGYNDVYVIDNVIYEINYPLSDKQCIDFCNKNKLYNRKRFTKFKCILLNNTR